VIDAIGGELKATPLQWAARNGHLYVIHLLISRGADGGLVDGQGFNVLHLVVHSSAVMPLLYMVSPGGGWG
jgi:ankyrin repeat protein